MIHPTRRALAGTAIALALLLGACSSSGSDDAGSTTTSADETTTTEAEETTTTEAEVDDEALARAEAVRLELDDFPDGWSAEAPTEEDDAPNPLAECDPVFDDESLSLATHTSDDISIGSLDDGDGTVVAAESKVFVDEDTAVAALDPFNDPDVVACIDQAIKDLFEPALGATMTGEMGEDDLGLDAELGIDQSEGVSGEYVLELEDGTALDALVAVLVMRNADVGVLTVITSFGDSLDPTALEGPIVGLAERLSEV
jgi:hypothetical protein